MKKLLFSLVFAGVSAVTVNAQASKTWNFSTNGTQAAVSANFLDDKLAYIPGPEGAANSFGVIEAHSPGSAGVFADFSFSKRNKTGGNSYSNSTPANFAVFAKRYLYFAVTGDSEIKVYFRSSGSGSRTLYVTDGTSVLGSATATDSSTNYVLTVNYTGGAGNIYIGGTNGFNYYQITATNVGETVLPATMAVNDVKSEVKATAFSSGNKIYISNLESKSADINVYSSAGSLVKSLKTSADTNFEITAKGLYIVNIKSVAGEKSVKVLLK